MKKIIVALLIGVGGFVGIAWGQPAQTIKGRVVDADSEISIPGVNVVVMETNPQLGIITDLNGYFTIEDVPVGRYTIQISFMGYEPAILSEVMVGSGKEVVLNVALKETYQQLNEVVVKPQQRKDKAQNNMATLSARSFTVEEAGRFAGGWNDPSRLAGSFAGVTMAEGVNDNAIVVRGNAPKGILWRLEGVEIPAPNHLNGINNGGGIETVFSVNMLDNSDFFTGAFPAEYGNAMSGVFDMKFRNGNNDKRESAFQIGSQGIDISSEGPFKKGGDASYLFNYRYSSMGLVGQLAHMDVGLPNYQDLSFKLHLPTKKAGTFSFWGIGGKSNVAFEPDEDPNEWETSWDNNEYDTGSEIAAGGINHRVNIGQSSYVFTSLVGAFDGFTNESEQFQRDGSVIPIADHSEKNYRLIASTYLNHKFGNRHTNRTGVTYTNLSFDLDIKGNPNPGVEVELIRIADQRDNSYLMQAYTQSKFRVAPTIDVNAGMNFSYFGLNEEFIPEPRLGLTWRFIPKHSFSLAYGKHSRLEALRFYLAQNDSGNYLNPDLKVTKADHFVFSYDWRVSDNMSVKIEPYYQRLYDVPVIAGSSESLINYQWDMYFDEPLINTGTGSNVGVDITIERFMKDGYYYMFTGSFFDSKYKGGDGIERNTSYNRNVVLNLLSGKEWKVRENNLFSINGKLTYMGGNRFTPPNQELSKSSEMVVLDETRAFDWQESNKFYVDVAVNYRINRLNVSHVFILQGKNILMTEEMFGWAYDFKKQKVVPHGMTMVYPFFSYRLEF
ncbi:TonB-dependent receptor [Carboxylicivirga sp. A043]|uniref:TonB-dependent receptor n=1 Tax=Carboxylicivirga litoralis TaxID=2816963 RepID=UPI0021CB70D4|nr:TonB-dependent receptor [Carboxylicivirga sp. A043]MCU4157968.1 TonB-dependent receptor [Carboxylicivirga sp. A043]